MARIAKKTRFLCCCSIAHVRDLLPSSGRCLQGHYLATGLLATVFYNHHPDSHHRHWIFVYVCVALMLPEYLLYPNADGRNSVFVLPVGPILCFHLVNNRAFLSCIIVPTADVSYNFTFPLNSLRIYIHVYSLLKKWRMKLLYYSHKHYALCTGNLPASVRDEEGFSPRLL
jgi:hypothetical protein